MDEKIWIRISQIQDGGWEGHHFEKVFLKIPVFLKWWLPLTLKMSLRRLGLMLSQWPVNPWHKWIVSFLAMTCDMWGPLSRLPDGLRLQRDPWSYPPLTKSGERLAQIQCWLPRDEGKLWGTFHSVLLPSWLAQSHLPQQKSIDPPWTCTVQGKTCSQTAGWWSSWAASLKKKKIGCSLWWW